MPKFTGYPANWDTMSAYDKVQWVKTAFPGVTNEVPKMAGHIVNSGNMEGAPRQAVETAQQVIDPFKQVAAPVKQAISSVPKIGGQTGSEIYAQSLIDKQKTVRDASAGAAGAGAGLKGLAGLKMGAAASFGIPLAAGLIGALAIRYTKNKFDKETDQYVSEDNARHAELMKTIRSSRERNSLKNMLGKNAPETLESPKQENFDTYDNWQAAVRRYNALGHWAQPDPNLPISDRKKYKLSDEQINKIKESDMSEAEKNAYFERDMRLGQELGLPQ